LSSLALLGKVGRWTVKTLGKKIMGIGYFSFSSKGNIYSFCRRANFDISIDRNSSWWKFDVKMQYKNIQFHFARNTFYFN